MSASSKTSGLTGYPCAAAANMNAHKWNSTIDAGRPQLQGGFRQAPDHRHETGKPPVPDADHERVSSPAYAARPRRAVWSSAEPLEATHRLTPVARRRRRCPRGQAASLLTDRKAVSNRPGRNPYVCRGPTHTCLPQTLARDYKRSAEPHGQPGI